MNIITAPNNGNYFYIRPDTSICRDGNDYFCLDNILELTAYSFIYAKIDRAAKCVRSRFAERYYKCFGYGIHLSASVLDNKERQDDNLKWYVANSLDCSTFLSKTESYIDSNNKEHYDIIKQFNLALENISSNVSIRIGDLLVLENTIEPLTIIQRKPDAQIGISDIVKYKDIEVNIRW